MKLIVRRAHPKNDKERMFKLEVAVDDLKNPGKASMSLDGKEYCIEVHYD